MTSDGQRVFEYDPFGKMSKVRLVQNGESATVSYLTNALSQRVFKSEPQAEQTPPSQATLDQGFIDWLKKNFGWLFAAAQNNASIGTNYIYGDGGAGIPEWALLGEYDNGSAVGNGRTEYIWLPTEDGRAIPMGFYRNGKFFAVHSDHLGTPRVVTSDVNAPVWQWPYSGFGTTKPTGVLKGTPNPKVAVTNSPMLLKATNSIEFNLRNPGQIADRETGMWSNYYRILWEGFRYTQRDPSGHAGGLNQFGYVGGNPLNAIDPRGLASCTYSVTAHTLVCTPNSGGDPTTLGPNGVWSGVGKCADNASCANIPDLGPIVPGNYNMNKDDRSGHESFWRLEPNPTIPGWKCRLGLERCGFELHPGGTSLGCITADKRNRDAMTQYRDVDKLLNKESGGNQLRVVP